MRKRGFEIVARYKDAGLHLPVRKTACSAGYDIEAAEDCVLVTHQVVLVPTGIKAYMQPDEYLGLHARSGFSIKNQVSLINGQGIIDADYYNNAKNEGHIMIKVTNNSNRTLYVNAGDKIAQGIFLPYIKTDDDDVTEKRNGGIGSTGR